MLGRDVDLRSLTLPGSVPGRTDSEDRNRIPERSFSGRGPAMKLSPDLFGKSLKQCPVRPGDFDTVLRVPLHAQHKPARRVFNGFRDSIFTQATRNYTGSELIDSLVVTRVHRDSRLAYDTGQKRIRLYGHIVNRSLPSWRIAGKHLAVNRC